MRLESEGMFRLEGRGGFLVSNSYFFFGSSAVRGLRARLERDLADNM